MEPLQSEWMRDGDLLYTLIDQPNKRPGLPNKVNGLTVRVDSYAMPYVNKEALITRLFDFLSAPAAQPSLLGEAPLADTALAELEALHPSTALPWIQNGRFIGRAPEGLIAKSFIGEADAVYATAAANALPGLLARLRDAEAKLAAPASPWVAVADKSLKGALDSALETNRVLVERLQKAAKVLEGYEQWEANVLLEDAAWSTPAAHPWQTDELYDEWMNLQAQRNEVLRPAAPAQEGKEAAHDA